MACEFFFYIKSNMAATSVGVDRKQYYVLALVLPVESPDVVHKGKLDPLQWSNDANTFVLPQNGITSQYTMSGFDLQ